MRRVLAISFQTVQARWSVHLWMYLVSVLISSVPLFLFYQILQKEAGHSTVLNELVPDFSFLIFGDFMKESGKAFKSIFWYGLGAGFVGSVVYTFFSGGVLDELANPKRALNFKRFVKKSASLFPKYFGLLLLIGLLLFVFFLFSGIFYFVFVLLAEGSSERGYFFWLLPPTFLLFIFMSFGLVVSFYAKVFIYKKPSLNFVEAFWFSFYYVFRTKETVLMFWAIGVFGLIAVLIYLFLDKFIGMHSWFTILLMLVFQQILVFSKFVLKHWNYAVALKYFDDNPVELGRPMIHKSVVSEEQVENSDSESKLSNTEEGF